MTREPLTDHRAGQPVRAMVAASGIVHLSWECAAGVNQPGTPPNPDRIENANRMEVLTGRTALDLFTTPQPHSTPPAACRLCALDAFITDVLNEPQDGPTVPVLTYLHRATTLGICRSAQRTPTNPDELAAYQARSQASAERIRSLALATGCTVVSGPTGPALYGTMCLVTRDLLAHQIEFESTPRSDVAPEIVSLYLTLQRDPDLATETAWELAGAMAA